MDLREVVVKKVCSVCGKLTSKEVVTMKSDKDEIISHGYCKKHYEEALEQLKRVQG